MSETHAILRFKATNPETVARILHYLNENTRPVFDDEVAEQEKLILPLHKNEWMVFGSGNPPIV